MHCSIRIFYWGGVVREESSKIFIATLYSNLRKRCGGSGHREHGTLDHRVGRGSGQIEVGCRQRPGGGRRGRDGLGWSSQHYHQSPWGIILRNDSLLLFSTIKQLGSTLVLLTTSRQFEIPQQQPQPLDSFT